MSVRNKNWRNYGFEFMSIFIAVVSAFALSNWNDNRHNHNAETKILTEIYNGLEVDLKDIQSNKSGHINGIKATAYFKDILLDKPVSIDSFLFYYFNLTRDFISVQNTSGYEALKSRGLELIRNDSMRADIISLYEYDYAILRKLEEEYFETQFHKNYFKEINQILSNSLVLDKNKTISGISTPLKLSEQDEKVLLSYLWKIENNRYFILSQYSEVIHRIEELRADIGNEIEH